MSIGCVRPRSAPAVLFGYPDRPQKNSEIWSSFFTGDPSPLNKAVEENRSSDRDLENLIKSIGEINRQSEDWPGHTALTWFSKHGDAKMVFLLLKSKADVHTRDSNGDTPLHWASRNKDSTAAEVLLDNGADVNAEREDNQPQTPLHMACTYRRVETLELLLENGADPNNQGGSHFTLLHDLCKTSCKGNEIEIMQLLLEKGANPNASDNTGRTPLNWAFRTCKQKAAKLLLMNGAVYNILDEYNCGGRHLHKACRFGWADVVELLIERGAKANAADQYGQTPLDIAHREGHQEIIDLLENSRSMSDET